MIDFAICIFVSVMGLKIIAEASANTRLANAIGFGLVSAGVLGLFFWEYL